MGYKRRSGLSYKQSRVKHALLSPSIHQQFKNSWENGLNNALSKAEILKKQGWNVSLEKGALMESQAKRIMQQLKSQGCETEMLPVTEWAGEKVVFLAYKPRAQPVQIRKENVKQKPKKTRITTGDVKQAYIKQFFPKGEQPDPQTDIDDGFIIDPHRTTALVTRDALPSKKAWETMTQDAKEFHKNGIPIEEVDNTRKIRTALARARKLGKRFIVLGPNDNTINIQFFKKALTVLKGKKIRVFSKGKNEPVFFINEFGDTMIAAPAIEGYPLSTVISYRSVKALAA